MTSLTFDEPKDPKSTTGHLTLDINGAETLSSYPGLHTNTHTHTHSQSATHVCLCLGYVSLRTRLFITERHFGVNQMNHTRVNSLIHCPSGIIVTMLCFTTKQLLQHVAPRRIYLYNLSIRGLRWAFLYNLTVYNCNAECTATKQGHMV